MPEQESPFTAYLREVDTLLAGVSAQRREEIRQELLAHLEDAAEEYGYRADDPQLQRRVIASLGSSFDLASELYTVHQGGHTMLKRSFDICLAGFFLLICSPLFLVLAILIKLDSRGPVFYKDLRIGRNGHHYHLYKFRSMTTDNTQSITRSGRWLRKYSLDELPQLWNVLKGEMSLVGPRPAKPYHANLDDPNWRRILLARPGLASPALSRAGSTPASLLETNLRYIDKQSLRHDLQILGKALGFRRKG